MAEPGNHAADLVRCCGGAMRIRRAIIIPAILTLGVAGAVLVGPEMPALAAPASVAGVQPAGFSSHPCIKYHN
jgi:hypothetical protein